MRTRVFRMSILKQQPRILEEKQIFFACVRGANKVNKLPGGHVNCKVIEKFRLHKRRKNTARK